MAQVTRDMCERIIAAAARHEYFPLTPNEMRQLAYLAIQTIASAATVGEPNEETEQAVEADAYRQIAKRVESYNCNMHSVQEYVGIMCEVLQECADFFHDFVPASEGGDDEAVRIAANLRALMGGKLQDVQEAAQQQAEPTNGRLRKGMQEMMARLTFLLDEDQFAEMEQIAKSAGVEPEAVQQQAEPVWTEEMIQKVKQSAKELGSKIKPGKQDGQQAEPSDPNEIACSSCGLTMGENNALVAMKQAEPGADERAKFEAEVRKLWTPGYSCACDIHGTYQEPRVREMWAIWQAARAAQSDQRAGVAEDVRDAARYRKLRAQCGASAHRERHLAVVLCDWAKNLDPASTVNVWAQEDVDAERLDLLLDAAPTQQQEGGK